MGPTDSKFNKMEEEVVMATEHKNQFFDQVIQNIRKAAEANLKMQQDFFAQWANLWPGLPKPQYAWIEQAQEFQKKWSETISELAHKHHDVLEAQYQAAVKSLDEALQVAESKDPNEFRKRVEEFYRKTLDCLREVSEAQMGEFQNAVSKWTELVTESAGTPQAK
jgi:hypothetical protein